LNGLTCHTRYKQSLANFPLGNESVAVAHCCNWTTLLALIGYILTAHICEWSCFYILLKNWL